MWVLLVGASPKTVPTRNYHMMKHTGHGSESTPPAPDLRRARTVPAPGRDHPPRNLYGPTNAKGPGAHPGPFCLTHPHVPLSVAVTSRTCEWPSSGPHTDPDPPGPYLDRGS